MGFRFRKSFKIAPGVKFNLGKKSMGLSFGGKRGGISFNTRSGARARVSLPGTGLSYTTKLGSSKRKTSNTKKSYSKKSLYTNQNLHTRGKFYSKRNIQSYEAVHLQSAPKQPKPRRSTDPKVLQRETLIGSILLAGVGLLLLIAFPSIPTLIIFLSVMLLGMGCSVSVIKNPEAAVKSAMEYNAKLDEKEGVQEDLKESVVENNVSEMEDGNIEDAQPTDDLELDRQNYQWLCDNFPDTAPKSFSGYRRMKNANSENYNKLKGLAETKGHFL